MLNHTTKQEGMMGQYLTAMLNGHVVDITLSEYERIRTGEDESRIVADIVARLTREGKRR